MKGHTISWGECTYPERVTGRSNSGHLVYDVGNGRSRLQADVEPLAWELILALQIAVIFTDYLFERN